MNIKYTKELLEPIVKKCGSIRQVILKLGLVGAGGNYDNIKNKIKEFNLSISHFHGQLWNKGITGTTILTIEDIREKLILNSTSKTGNPISTHKLKKQLLHFKIKDPICENCLNSQWIQFQIPLELHHVNGNKFDNRIENLQLLCPNCHALTENYRGKNIKNKNVKLVITKRPVIKKEYFCSCGERINRKSKLCKKCWQLSQRKAERPSYEILLKEIEETNYCVVGRKYRVSDNAIRKWIKQYEKNLLQIAA